MDTQVIALLLFGAGAIVAAIGKAWALVLVAAGLFAVTL